MFEALEGTSNRPNPSVRTVAVFAKTPALPTIPSSWRHRAAAVSQLGSKHTFLCKPLEHDRYVHGEKPVSMESPDGQVFNEIFFSCLSAG